MEKKKPAKSSGKKAIISKPAAKKSFLVVGLGASAGGVKALREFFSMMPPNSGMAFAVVLHLSPEHESNLAEILQHHTSMPVIQVNEEHAVEPNHVYVISPNRQLEMIDGVVRCTESVEHKGARVAIDVFFRTLAEAYERNAVCVVLSGTGTDGTLGLKRVKESNGFAVVQDPEDAEYDDMPLSAIRTNLADWILPVRRMPESLIHFRSSSERLHLTSDDMSKVAREINADESLREIITLLRVSTGHDFSHYKTPTLIRRIARHLQIHNLEDIPSYLAYLRENPGEIQSLLKNLLINVTNFFRDKDAFGVLEREIVPRLFEGKKAKDTIRVWSAGCASGEEPFAIAMLLTEYAEKLSDPPKIQVFGTDVDADAINEAREHRYPESIEADVSGERLKRFFTKEGNFYRIRRELRELILFAPLNVLRDPPFSRLDLITCRNLLIYLNRDTQERLMEIFHFALVSNGFLFLGSSESADGVPNLYAPFDKKQRIYRKRRVALGQTLPPQMPLAGKWSTAPAFKKQVAAGARAFSLGDVHYKLLESIAPPSVLLNRDFEILYMSEGAGRFLRFKGGEPTQNLLKLVNPDLLPDLRAALFSVQREQKISRFDSISAVLEGDEAYVNLTARRVALSHEPTDYILVTFEENQSPLNAPVADGENGNQGRALEKDDRMEDFVRRLEEDLRRTKSQLRSTIEQHEVSIEELKSSNEEMQAINEELRSTTEELETSKEELQSVNEELQTVNSELKEKIDETIRVNSDLQNLIASTDIATIFLDRNLRIKRFTPRAQELFNIKPKDLGRVLAHFTHQLEYENLAADAEQVLQSMLMLEREVRDKQNRTFLARFAPYRTTDNRIEGVVLNFLDITGRKRAETDKFFLASIVESSEDSMITIDFDRNITSWNKAAERLYGYLAKEVIGKPLTMLTLPADLQEVLANVDKIKHSEKVKIFDTFRLNKDGREMNLEVVLSPVRDAAGEIIGVSTIARDVTERRQAEKAVRFHANLLNTIEQSVIATDLDGMVIYWNRFAEKLYGWTAKEALGRRIMELTTPEMFAGQAEEIMSDVRQGKSWTGEFTVRRKDGTTFPAQVFNSPITDAEEKLIGIVGASVDITDRKKGEAELRQSEERLRLLVESATDYAIFTVTKDNLVDSWSVGAENIFGWKEKQILGKNAALLFTPEDREHGVPVMEMQGALATGRAEDERWHIRKDGSRFYASGLMQPLLDDDGKHEGFVKICRDETEKIKIETALQDKKMLAQLVSTQEDERRRIARDIHDHLGQQLTVLRHRLEAVKKMCDDQKICDEIEAVQKITASLDAEVDFLAWELRPAALDDLGLQLTLSNFVQEWSHHTQIKADIHVTGLTKTRLPFETETNLYRIAQEALNNIYKHAQAKNVSVLLEKRKETVSLIIEDDGVGFNPKSKLNRTKGIGMVGMLERAKICGGALEIESSKGNGTTVFARIPAKLK
jgi:two-component system CheB/CheR fusion protein